MESTDMVEKSLSYKEKVYAQLKRSIISRVLKPGDVLNERSLAENLNVSRTPVREAIQMLEAKGWVKVLPWKGAVILSVTQDEVEEVLQLRMLLEPFIIESVIAHLNRDSIAYLESLLVRQRMLANNGVEFISTDQEFHLFLAKTTGNKRLLQFMIQLRDMQLRLGVTAVQCDIRFEQTLLEHEAIITALRKKECILAKQAMINHLIQTRFALMESAQAV